MPQKQGKNKPLPDFLTGAWIRISGQNIDHCPQGEIRPRSTKVPRRSTKGRPRLTKVQPRWTKVRPSPTKNRQKKSTKDWPRSTKDRPRSTKDRLRLTKDRPRPHSFVDKYFKLMNDSEFLANKGSVSFFLLWICNFMPKFRMTSWPVFDKKWLWTDRRTQSNWSLGFKYEIQKLKSEIQIQKKNKIQKKKIKIQKKKSKTDRFFNT